MKAGTSHGAMPAKLSLNMRPKAAAGLANDVEEVNQYAAPM
nr:major intrinsic domain protein [Lysobacter capsici]